MLGILSLTRQTNKKSKKPEEPIMKTIKITTILIITLLAAMILAACDSNEPIVLPQSDVKKAAVEEQVVTKALEDAVDVPSEAINYSEEENEEEEVRHSLPRRDQVLDFRHWEHLPENVKEDLQEMLNTLGNPTEGEISLAGIEVSYTMVENENDDDENELIPDGGLYFVAFVRNGMDRPVDISRIKITISVDEEVIENDISRIERIVVASAYFHVDFGTIMPTQSIIQQFNFSDDLVLIKDADLSYYYWNVEYQY